MVLARMLEDAGWRVAAVADGTGAVSEAAAKRFDVILLDGRMPGLDGIGAAQAIRMGGPNRFTPVALISADGLSEAPEGLFCARLLKPYEPAALMRLLSDVAPAAADAA
jgi:CheY-like chemotaxis protein